MKIAFNAQELAKIEQAKKSISKHKRRLLRGITPKSRYLFRNYLFIKSNVWFGVYRWNVNCPNFQSTGVTYRVFGWNITKMK